jgi:hypothetical protein
VDLVAQRAGPVGAWWILPQRSSPAPTPNRSEPESPQRRLPDFPSGGLAVRPELLFSLKGGRTLAELEGGGTATLDIELAYLELPVLAHFAPAVGRYRPVFFAGPAPALQIGCDLQLVIQPDPLRLTCSQADITFREWDLGMVLGGGVEAHFNRATLALEARYTAGLRRS